jgi:hypothetical protein
MRFYAYPVAGKQKSLQICSAFAAGCGGRVLGPAAECREGGAIFFGVDASNAHVWRDVQERRLPFVYLDNSYHDKVRGRYFRATLNRLQCSGLGTSDGRRFDALGVPVRPWRSGGRTVILCPQSPAFHADVLAGDGASWVPRTATALASAGLTVKVRAWQRDKGKQAETFAADLDDAMAVVTWSSAAAVTALLEGLPVVTLGESAASPLAGSLLELMQGRLPLPSGRREWAGVLADAQFTLAEMANGTAWRMMRAQAEAFA